MPELSSDQLRQFIRLGAQARLAQLDVESAAIRAAYPDLAPARRRGRPRQAQAGAAPALASKPRKRRYRMSFEARKAAAERMRKYWAERRKGKK